MEDNFMDDDFDTAGSDDEKKESGGSLRKKLEEALREKDEMTSLAKSLKAKDLISSQGFKYVTPQDLADVGLSDIEAVASALEAKKAADAEELLKTALKAKGLEGDSLDSLLAGLTAGESDEQAASHQRLRDVGKIAGTPVKDPFENLSGPDLIKAAFGSKKN